MTFYSYSHNTGIQYHATGKEAKEAAEKAVRTFAHNGITDAEVVGAITWGEVTERAVNTGAGYAFKRQLLIDHEAENPAVVNGRMRNGNDDLVLVKNIHETDLMYHDMVLFIAVIWKDLAGKIERFKQYNFLDVQSCLALLHEKYGVKRGGTDGNMTFFTFDRKFKLQVAIQKAIGFGPELQAAEQKLMEAIDEMTAAGDTEETSDLADLRTIVTASFKLVDGKVRVSEVLRLRTYKIKNALWNEAMRIIDDAIIVTAKKKQIRLYERSGTGGYVAVPLDIAAL